MKGYIDRIEDHVLAVIIIEEMNKQLEVPTSQLPEGAIVGSWLEIELENDEVKKMKLSSQTTAEKAQEASDLLARLRSKGSGSRFKKE